jgi:hypothetical protein
MIKVNKLTYEEPRAVRCACGILCANPASYSDHSPYCKVVQETGVMFSELHIEEGKEHKIPKRRFLIGSGDKS